MNNPVITVLALFTALSLATNSRADIIDKNSAALSGKASLESLGYIQQYTNIDTNDAISGAFAAFAHAMNAATKTPKTDPRFAGLVQKADLAYTGLITAYERAVGELAQLEHERYADIFDVIEWDQDAFASCVNHRKELLALLKSGSASLQDVAADKAALSDELRECANRIEAVSATLMNFIRSTNEEIAKQTARLQQAKKELADATAAGDTTKAEELQKEINKLEEEIPKKEQMVKKAQEVSRGFDLEKFLQGVGKVVLGVVTILFSGECEENSDTCNQIGAQLINEGFKDVTNSFDATSTEYRDVAVPVPADRPAEARTKEAAIKTTIESTPVTLCCKLPEEITLIPTDEKGPISFAFELTNGRVSKLVLIQNSNGARIADISDADLFFSKPVSLNIFSTILRAQTIENSTGTHILLVEGPGADGKPKQLAIAINPLTHSGKFKVAVASRAE